MRNGSFYEPEHYEDVRLQTVRHVPVVATIPFRKKPTYATGLLHGVMFGLGFAYLQVVVIRLILSGML
jgi:hypothetical protein